MKSSDVLQVAIVLLLVATAASCEVAKEYSTRVFKPATPQKKSDAIALRFMQFDSDNASDSIDLKDLANQEIKEIDKIESPMDTAKTEVAVVESKTILKNQPIEATKRGTTRTKKIRQ